MLQTYQQKCRTPRHLVDLYLQSVGRKRQAQGSKFEAHFNLQTNDSKENDCSTTVLPEPKDNQHLQQSKDPLNTEDTLIEYSSNDMFGDFK